MFQFIDKKWGDGKSSMFGWIETKGFSREWRVVDVSN